MTMGCDPCNITVSFANHTVMHLLIHSVPENHLDLLALLLNSYAYVPYFSIYWVLFCGPALLPPVGPGGWGNKLH